MKSRITAAKLAIAAVLFCTPLLMAQSYDLSWHTIDGGGGASTSGTLTLTGTIGQPDAGLTLTGGGYALTGGFWPGASATSCTLPGDMNHDGHIDGDDIQLFINCLLSGTGSCGCADMDGNGLSPSDVPAFVAALLSA